MVVLVFFFLFILLKLLLLLCWFLARFFWVFLYSYACYVCYLMRQVIICCFWSWPGSVGADLGDAFNLFSKLLYWFNKNTNLLRTILDWFIYLDGFDYYGIQIRLITYLMMALSKLKSGSCDALNLFSKLLYIEFCIITTLHHNYFIPFEEFWLYVIWIQ